MLLNCGFVSYLISKWSDISDAKRAMIVFNICNRLIAPLFVQDFIKFQLSTLYIDRSCLFVCCLFFLMFPLGLFNPLLIYSVYCLNGTCLDELNTVRSLITVLLQRLTSVESRWLRLSQRISSSPGSFDLADTCILFRR